MPTRQVKGISFLNKWVNANPRLLADENDLYVTDIDLLISHKLSEKRGDQSWMLLDGKQHLSSMKNGQFYDFGRMHRAIVYAYQHGFKEGRYDGFHIVQHEGETIPASVYLDKKKISSTDLEDFILGKHPEWFRDNLRDHKFED